MPSPVQAPEARPAGADGPAADEAREQDAPRAAADVDRPQTRPADTAPPVPAPAPPRPGHGPAVPPRRPAAAPAGTDPETTARLRLPRAGARAASAAGPGAPATETTARLRPVPAAPADPEATAAAGRGRRDEAGGAPAGDRRPPPPPPAPPSGTGPAPAPPAGTGPASAPPAGTGPASAPPAGTAPGAGPAVPPDPALSWNAPAPSAGSRPLVSLGEPEAFEEPRRGSRRGRGLAAVVCLVLGLGLIGGAAAGSWLTGDSGDSGAHDTFATAAELWHTAPVDRLFPPTVRGQGAGPGGADRTWTRIAVAPDGNCGNAFDPLLSKVLAPIGCERLLRATYTDATRSYVTTVGLLFAEADENAMRTLGARFAKEHLSSRADLMPRPYAAAGTPAAGFGAAQRASWTVSVLTDAPVVVYAVSGWADGRAVDAPQPAEQATASGATTAPAQAGLGNEAQGLADRIARGLRIAAAAPSADRTAAATAPTEKHS
ncbi:hypothetical protein ACL02U_24195 [Streptomyces sp. MS06]|uniref:hypothetical protein n=1 Tax=Streptomyces sp. MS06 TaxID=3385974 RepID=UPI0039A1357A